MYVKKGMQRSYHDLRPLFVFVYMIFDQKNRSGHDNRGGFMIGATVGTRGIFRTSQRCAGRDVKDKRETH